MANHFVHFTFVSAAQLSERDCNNVASEPLSEAMETSVPRSMEEIRAARARTITSEYETVEKILGFCSRMLSEHPWCCGFCLVDTGRWLEHGRGQSVAVCRFEAACWECCGMSCPSTDHCKVKRTAIKDVCSVCFRPCTHHNESGLHRLCIYKDKGNGGNLIWKTVWALFWQQKEVLVRLARKVDPGISTTQLFFSPKDLESWLDHDPSRLCYLFYYFCEERFAETILKS